MCIIVDASVASDFFASPPATPYDKVWKWIDGGRGRLVLGGKLTSELSKVAKARRAIQHWSRSGRAQFISDDKVLAEEAVVEELGLSRSNDRHIVALARVSCGRLLCSSDIVLCDDFKNARLISNPRGAIYNGKPDLLRKKSHVQCRIQHQTHTRD